MIIHREYLMIHELRSERLSISEIGRRLGIDRKTVCKYMQCVRNEFAVATRQPKVSSKIDISFSGS